MGRKEGYRGVERGVERAGRKDTGELRGQEGRIQGG